MNHRIADHPRAFVGLRFAGLELRFDQRDDSTARFQQCNGSGKNFTQRNEGAINHHQISACKTYRELRRRKSASVGLFHDHHPRVAAELPCQLPLAHVHCVHPRRAALQETIGETARRGAEVNGHGAGCVRLKFFQGVLEFEAAPAHEFLRCCHR